MPKYGDPIWKHVFYAANMLKKSTFAPKDIIEKIHEKKPEIPANTIRTYVIAMAPNHPSSHHYPSTRKNHPYFQYLGNGKFKLIPVSSKIQDWDKKRKSNIHETRGIKQEFIKNYEEIITKWTIDNRDDLISGRKNYSWGGKSLIECLDERNRVSKFIVLSRIKNDGGVDLRTLDRIMSWGGFGPFPLREDDEVLKITQKAFNYVDEGNFKGAIYTLLKINGVGIASASKTIGLYDQNSLAIYDSRVGTTLRTLRKGDVRIIKCPPGRSRPGDACTKNSWAENYERLIWTLEVMRNILNNQGYPFSIADVEIALFMMGK